jgi:hypothetical protein
MQKLDKIRQLSKFDKLHQRRIRKLIMKVSF